MNTNQTETQTLDPAVITAALNEALYTHLVKPKHDCTYVNFTHLKNIIRRHRPWFERESYHHTLHPAINLLLNLNDRFSPPTPNPYLQYVNDWTQILLEWPHVSMEDPSKIAYTQDDRKGESNIQTRTTLGRYIKRHCPTIPDHVLRDFVAVNDTHAGEIGFVHHLQGMIEAVQAGPKSCMRSNQWSEDNHPYNVYLPEYGWHMAYRKVNGRVWGRCLCLKHNDELLFVRSYKRDASDPENGYSYADPAIEAWLKDKGYEKADAWPHGAKLAKITNNRSQYIMAYIDGNNQDVRECDDHFVISKHGGYCANNTDGLLENENLVSCSCCGNETPEDELHSVGYYGDDTVCEHCADHNFTYVTGRRGEEYRVLNDDAVWVGGSMGAYYDCNYLSENDIVWCEDISEYLHQDDAWVCEESGNWYSADEEYVEIDGMLYHPDHAPEQEEDEDEDDNDE